MPYVSDATVNWANGVLRNGSFSARKAMLTTNAVLPPSGGIKLAAIAGPNAEFKDVVALDYSKLKIGAASDSIAFIKLRPNEKNEVGAMTFVMKSPQDLPSVASRVGWTAVWWLPWQNSHIVKIKIRSAVTEPNIIIGGGADPVPNPPIFFTAAINGCSVFAVGDTQAPSMYHGGSDGPMAKRGEHDANELTEAAWRRLLGRVGTVKNVKGIGKTDYVTELNPHPANDDDRLRVGGLKTTTAANNLEQDLLARGGLTNVTVMPFGMVFGLRDDHTNNWTMTLTKNAFVSCKRMKVVSTKRLFRSPKITNVVEGEIRNERKYDADGTLTETVVVTESAIQSCHALGFQDFFPGLGAAHMHNVSTIHVV